MNKIPNFWRRKKTKPFLTNREVLCSKLNEMCWNIITLSKKTSLINNWLIKIKCFTLLLKLMLLMYDTFKASDSKTSSLEISLLRNKWSFKNPIFSKLLESFLCYKDKFENCTVQWMIRNNCLIEIGNILKATGPEPTPKLLKLSATVIKTPECWTTGYTVHWC